MSNLSLFDPAGDPEPELDSVAARVGTQLRRDLITLAHRNNVDLSTVIRIALRDAVDTNLGQRARLINTLGPHSGLTNRPTQAQAEAQRDTGIASADHNADPAWKDEALAAIRTMALTHDDFTIDEVWTATHLRRPHEARAMGAVVQRARRAGLIAATDRTRPSNSSNRSPMIVWRSLLRP